ncbi:PAP2-domain-containing protein [Pleurostoma richardsiae]|uniref:Dolichyldiphosphatase n=1 Tax=Pleurostoma richardsiae TaxID=41990 RepID=A0AA38VR68_9PEZI|nr:PAP2-domain-containing protein [Pleurostoma richardsiae]
MSYSTGPLASLSLTHVYYDPDDPVSYLCAFLALVPHALCVVYATLIWSTREAEVALMFAGQLACEAVNFALKRLIKEERPPLIHQTGKGYGMPSSHAQFASFWAVATALFLLVRHRPRSAASGGVGRRSEGGSRRTAGPRAAERGGNGAAAAGARTGTLWEQLGAADIEAYAHRPWSVAERAAASACALLLAAMVAWSRVYLNYHTVKQVLVGSLAGVLSAVAWFGVTDLARRWGLLLWAIDQPVARWFRIRDLIVDEDLCQAGWEKWETERLALRQAKDK